MPPKEILDQEALYRQKFRAKCQFRAIGRLVIANAYWLIEALEHYEGDDVKRRVEQAVRAKSKKTQLLNINDKAILNKPAEERTEAERKYLYRLIGGLKCFKRYPNNVKRKLAAVMYFKYIGPGRVIVRQNQEAHALYFVVTGDVVISLLLYDELEKKNFELELGQMHAGDMFGEVSLLHNIKRTATCSTVGHCEFLVLIKEDFKNILQASLQKQWDEILHAMSSFTYFDCLDEVSRREGCIVTKMKSYKPDDVIFGEGAGIANYVYFVLSGRCQMVESLQVITTTHSNRTFYTLYDPYVPPVESDQDLNEKYFGTKESDKPKASTDKLKRVSESSDSKKDSVAGLGVVKRNSARSKMSSITSKQRQQSTYTRESVKLIEPLEPVGEEEEDSESTVFETSDQDTIDSKRDSKRSSIKKQELTSKKNNMQTIFMQVCQFSAGATFGFGENMRDRRIVALTRVDCMLMPLVWLLQRNTANIWSRIQRFLEKKIPTKRQLFNKFVHERRWIEYRDRFIDDVIQRSQRAITTTIHDVPYSIRMEEMIDMTNNTNNGYKKK